MTTTKSPALPQGTDKMRRAAAKAAEATAASVRAAAARTAAEAPARQQTGAPPAAVDGAAYRKALAALETAESAAPSYHSEYDAELDALYKQITGRGEFKYELGSDPLYGQLREQYTALGLDAMRDTQGQAAALTGGYASSYSQSAGQQQYDAYLQKLAGEVPGLYSLARSAYDAEGERLNGVYSLTRERESDAYSRYSDDYSRYLSERGYLSDRAESEYGKAMDEAALLAQYGDFGVYGELYGEDKEKLMADTWYLANPLLAYKLGLIDSARYRELVGPQQQSSSGGRYSAAVAKQQRALRSAGHSEVIVDGVMGPVTAAAQRAENEKQQAAAAKQARA